MAAGKKRANGEGSLFFDSAKKRWVAQVSLPGGRLKKKTAVSQREARKFLTAMKAEIDTTGGLVNEQSRVSDLTELWRHKVLLVKDMAPSTRATKEWALRHIEDSLGGIKLVKLNVLMIERFLLVMSKGGLGRESLIKIRNVLNQVCEFGERRDLLRRNPVGLALLPSGLSDSKPGKALTVEQAELLLKATNGDRFHALWAIMLMLGLRPGEAAGLHWEDIDCDSGVVHVRRNLRKVKSVFEVSYDLKTQRSRRSLDMPKVLLEKVEAHRKLQDREQAKAGSSWSPHWEGLVFTTTTGTPLDPSNLRRDFKAMTKDLGLGGLSPVDLRHSCVSILSAAGVPLEHIADVAGHDGTRMTAKVYRHAVTPSVAAAALPMDGMFGSG